MPLDRRTFVASASGLLAGAATSTEALPDRIGPILGLHRLFPAPVRLRSLEALQLGKDYFVRVQSSDGAAGITAAGARLPDLLSLFKRLVVPFFLKKDARDLETLVDEVYLHRSQYKYAGMPFWHAVALAELAVFDLLGRLRKQPVHALLGKALRTRIAVYVSRFARDTTAQAEVKAAVLALERTGARAVKLKIGERMKTSPRQDRRDRDLVALARKSLGPKVALYVDANGSYTPRQAIAMGKFLQEHSVGFLEEPCPWEEYEQTREVAGALKLTIAGGEQDTSWPRWRWLIGQRALGLVQPDLFYNGGLIRALRVARLAEKAKVLLTPHSPRSGAAAAPMLHLVAVLPNAGPHQEYRASGEIKDGFVAVPAGPGLSEECDPKRFGKAVVL
jgi:L-alanine-DL-glutamate epimerase-like enolase superfamily enzyme